ITLLNPQETLSAFQETANTDTAGTHVKVAAQDRDSLALPVGLVGAPRVYRGNGLGRSSRRRAAGTCGRRGKGDARPGFSHELVRYHSGSVAGVSRQPNVLVVS